MTIYRPNDEPLLNALVNETSLFPAHLRVIAARAPQYGDWPQWAHPDLVRAYGAAGIERPWRHQAAAASAAYTGTDVVLATGTASGKSLAYQLPVLSALAADPTARAIYLAPTKALAADQIRGLSEILREQRAFNSVGACAYDGDTPSDVRQWAREHSRWLFTNPDMLHAHFLPRSARWRGFLRNLRFIVIDECHHYRGMFGAHTAWVLRRLLRLAAAEGAAPVVIGASATVGDPAGVLSRLTGRRAIAITDDASPSGAMTVALVKPENDSDGQIAARTLAELVVAGARTLCFVRSRHGVEVTALTAARIAAELQPDAGSLVAAYRGGYLAHDRRALEHALTSGRLRGVATTNALELGIDVAGLDAVVVVGYPGTVASFWQQAGRAGRRGQKSLVVLIARDDPLDNYLVHHPEALLDRAVETTIFDYHNPHAAADHLLCAATESPLLPSEVADLGVQELVDELTAAGRLRRRTNGWFAAPQPNGESPHADIDIRGGIGDSIAIIDSTTGQLLGTVDTSRAPSAVHPGAVHLHRGETYLVDELDFVDAVAFVHPEIPDYRTEPLSTTDVRLTDVTESHDHHAVGLMLAQVRVTSQVMGFLRRNTEGAIIDSVSLDMPSQVLDTVAAVITIAPEALESHGIGAAAIPGALHAAEHALIGMLPLLATCDRWDLGGLSTAAHPDTGLPTIFVYDGYSGGAGFAAYGYRSLALWLEVTASAIASCECQSGCPGCVQSPKCGNGNDPLDKAGAVTVLRLVSDCLATDNPGLGR